MVPAVNWRRLASCKLQSAPEVGADCQERRAEAGADDERRLSGWTLRRPLESPGARENLAPLPRASGPNDKQAVCKRELPLGRNTTRAVSCEQLAARERPQQRHNRFCAARCALFATHSARSLLSGGRRDWPRKGSGSGRNWPAPISRPNFQGRAATQVRLASERALETLARTNYGTRYGARKIFRAISRAGKHFRTFAQSLRSELLLASARFGCGPARTNPENCACRRRARLAQCAACMRAKARLCQT